PWRISQIMRISIAQIFLALILSGISHAHLANAQEFLNNPISLKSEHAKLRLILSSIEKQAGVGFVYSSKAIKADRKVSVDVDKRKLSDVLNIVLDPLGISYRIVEGQIILYPTNHTQADI